MHAKVISIAELQAMVARSDWQYEQNIHTSERTTRYETAVDDKTDLMIEVAIPHVFGFASKVSTLDDITITYQEGFSYDECMPDTLDTSIEGMDVPWAIDGVTVLDEDGDEVELTTLIKLIPSRFAVIDYTALNIAQITDIDYDKDSTMETFILNIDNEPSLRFTGELLGSAASSNNNASSRYSGQTGRWTELALYKTQGGKYICHQIGLTQWEGERDRFTGKVCETLEEVKEFFGHRWLAKELYQDAGIDDVTDIE